MDKPQNYDGCKLECKNKRKRRCSSTEVDRTTKKVALQVGVAEDNENPASRNNYSDVTEDSLSFSELEELCDEVLYEIFKFLDTWSLMALMNVCNRFKKIALDKRLWENIDLSRDSLPLGILEDMLERSHDKTRSIKLRGPSPSQHIEGEIQHFNETIRNSLTTRCTKLVTLELYGVTLNFNQITLTDFPQTLKRLVLNTCNVRVFSNKSLFAGVETILVNLEELAIENNFWFDPYYLMPLSKLPLLRYLSLRGCKQMQEFIPYGSIAARHGFKLLEILDLRDTPLNDSDLQCFNAVETLKEIYLQCPDDESSEQISSNGVPNCKIYENMNEPAVNTDSPCSSGTSATMCKNENKKEKADDSLAGPSSLSINDNECTSSSSSSSSTSSNQSGNIDTESVASNSVTLVGTNTPSRSGFLPRPDHIFCLDVRNRTSPIAVHFNVRDHFNLRLRIQVEQQNQQQLASPVIEQMVRHNLFWDIVNPLGRAAGVGRPDRLFSEENSSDYYLNYFSLSNRQQSRGTISDRGVCCFGRTRQPVQQGVIWIRFNNRPSENRFERFSVRDYKFVTDVSLQHLVQCSPNLIFLDVSGTSVTLEGLQRFKNLKPECSVVAEHLLDVMNNQTVF